MIKTNEFIKANPKEVEEFVVSKFNYEKDYVKTVWPKFESVAELTQYLVMTLEDQARWRIDNKLTDKTEVPNYLNFIYKDALMKIKPEAVTIY